MSSTSPRQPASGGRPPGGPSSGGPAASPRRPMGGGPFGRGPGAGMGMPVEKAANFKGTAKRLIRRLETERLRLIIVFSFAAASVAMNVAAPKVLGHATDVIFQGFLAKRQSGGSMDMDKLHSLLATAMALFVGGVLLSLIQALIVNGVVQRTMYRLRNDVESKINRLPLDYFDTRTRGEVLSRVTNDVDNIAQTLQMSLSRSVSSILTVIGVIVMMFVVSPLLAVVALVGVPLSIVATTLIGKRSQKLFIAQWSETGALNGHIEDAFSGHSLVKTFGRQTDVQRTFDEKNEALYKASFGAQMISSLIMPLMWFVGNFTYVLLAVVGGLRITSGAMTVGEVQAVIQYSRQFTQPLTELASMANTFQSGVASAERVFEFLDADEESAEPAAVVEQQSTSGRVEFHEVSFSYKADVPLIEKLSLVAKPGQTVAIVGPTGAGKTTLVNLIMRFYEVQSGRITIDDVDISTLSRQQVRSKVGMVLQDAWLFGGTIRDNIAYGSPGATEDEIVEAAKATFVDRFVRVLPDGYDTIIEDGAGNLSAGERQLITIARAFLTKPALLILDEATSSVDTRTEVLVQHAMAALRKQRTSFVIAHRLSTIRDADLILVMESGRIVEQGNHNELLERHGAYFELYNSQFTAPASEGSPGSP